MRIKYFVIMKQLIIISVFRVCIIDLSVSGCGVAVQAKAGSYYNASSFLTLIPFRVYVLFNIRLFGVYHTKMYFRFDSNVR